MSLEFNKILDQIAKMSSMIEALDFDARERLQLALRRYDNLPDINAIQERIELVRQSDISGYRGAVPLDGDVAEPMNAIFATPQLPPSATILAADGSQVYPNEQHPVHYYLINIGLYIYHHGADLLPEQSTIPQLAYHKSDVHDRGRVVSNRTVDARRTLNEMQALSDLAWERRGAARPLVALYDNRLLYWVSSDVTGADEIVRQYQDALKKLHDSQATLAGYLDRPVSRLVMRLLYLMSLRDAAEIKEKQLELQTAGDLSGLTDRQLFDTVLRPGERSALMVQNSPRNLSFKEFGDDYEIAFFYLKVSSGYRTSIARVDVPMWVARDARAIDELHALLVSQASMQGRNPYPYALTRADEIAVVSSTDKRKLDEMINIELRKKHIEPYRGSAKDFGKVLARSSKRRMERRRN